MEKLLVLSDVHYPLPISPLFTEIIEKENPDKVILLGDNVDNYGSRRDLLDIYKEFIGVYKSLFPLERTILLIGDNDYQGRKDVLDYVKSLPKINGSDIFTYTYKNLFLFHGNIESAHWQELIGKYAGIISSKINVEILPQMLAKRVIQKYQIPSNFIVLLGHIHYLGQIGRTMFCGTLNENKIIYPKELSMGYVVIDSNNSAIKESDITFVKI